MTTQRNRARPSFQETIYRVGSSVGLIGATTFVLVDRGLLPPVLQLAAVVVWACLLVLALWAVWVRRPVRHPVAARPGRSAGLVYALSCVAMVAVIVVGTGVLSSHGHRGAQPALVAAAVGLHFVPFAVAFRTPFFGRLGVAITLIGVLGLGAALAAGAVWAAGAAVLAGITMTAMIAADAARR